MTPARDIVRCSALRWLAAAWVLCSVVGYAGAAAPQEMSIEQQARAMMRAGQAVVGVQAQALEDARSNASLGRERAGSGVVIGDDGLVLTIGYLILEAEQVDLLLDGQRTVPARVVAYDVATGFGLVQSLAPINLAPVPLATRRVEPSDEPLTFMSGGPDGDIRSVQLVSRRPFAGYWEYLLDDALYTGPARDDHAGAALFNLRGELVGIGSLLVSDAVAAGRGMQVPGNLFVPVDLLPPILAELRRDGRSSASHRAWLGVNCVEQAGQVRVIRVSDDSPADVAGLQPGDRIERIDGTEVRALDVLWKSLWAGGSPEREVTLDIRRGDELQTMKLQSVDRMKTLRRSQGI